MIESSGRRRPILAACALVSAVALVLLGLAALENTGDYTILIDFGAGIFALAWVLASALLVACAAWLTRTRGARTWAVGITATICGALLCAGLAPAMFMQDMGSADDRTTVAVSPDGEYELSAGKEGLITRYMILRLRSRDGLLSRESGEVACFGADSMDSPESRFVRAEFTGPMAVTIWSDTGESATVWFDPATLSLSPAFDTC